jgi:hypothetical protein
MGALYSWGKVNEQEQKNDNDARTLRCSLDEDPHAYANLTVPVAHGSP